MAKRSRVDGATVSVYTPKIKTVQVFDVRKGLVDQFLLLGFGASSAELKADYDVTSCWERRNWGTKMPGIFSSSPSRRDVLKNLKKAELWIAQTSGLPAQEKLFTSPAAIINLSPIRT